MKIFYYILYLALDYAIVRENLQEHGQPIHYCVYGKRSAFVEKYLPYDWARSWYWGAFRNSAINLMTLTEKWIGEKTGIIYRKEWGKSFYELRQFASGLKLPYLEYWFGAWRLQIGFISCGRFQQQFKKYV